MIKETVDFFAQSAVNKIQLLRNSLLRYFLLSGLAGIYVGFGIILIFSIGAPLANQQITGLSALMGASFGIALTLVVFAGSELFTGNNMVMVIGALSKKIKWLEVVYSWFICYLGNILGSLLLAYLIFLSGALNNIITIEFIHKIASFKMSLGFWPLFFKGVLCNMLVCLAIWASARTKEDIAKIFLIFWCLFAFIGSGFEHSVANMTIFGLALFAPHNSELISWIGFWHNLIPVTLGNMVGGGVFIGATYWYIANKKTKKSSNRNVL